MTERANVSARANRKPWHLWVVGILTLPMLVNQGAIVLTTVVITIALAQLAYSWLMSRRGTLKYTQSFIFPCRKRADSVKGFFGRSPESDRP